MVCMMCTMCMMCACVCVCGVYDARDAYDVYVLYDVHGVHVHVHAWYGHIVLQVLIYTTHKLINNEPCLDILVIAIEFLENIFMALCKLRAQGSNLWPPERTEMLYSRTLCSKFAEQHSEPAVSVFEAYEIVENPKVWRYSTLASTQDRSRPATRSSLWTRTESWSRGHDMYVRTYMICT